MQENSEATDIAKHFPTLSPLLDGHGTNMLITSRNNMPHQRTIYIIVDQLNDKSKHLYNLPFQLRTLRNSQIKDAFLAPIISYLEDNHLPSNKKRQDVVIAEAEHYLLFSDLLFRFSIRKENETFGLCIPHELCDGLFEIYHSGLLSSHQGLTRTYYKIRQDFYVRNLYKYLYLYIMSCRICSARRDIPFNLKQRSWSSAEIEDFNIMQSISLDLKVMPTSYRGYNYLMVMSCNNSRYIITDILKTRKAKKLQNLYFKN